MLLHILLNVKVIVTEHSWRLWSVTHIYRDDLYVKHGLSAWICLNVWCCLKSMRKILGQGWESRFNVWFVGLMKGLKGVCICPDLISYLISGNGGIMRWSLEGVMSGHWLWRRGSKGCSDVNRQQFSHCPRQIDRWPYGSPESIRGGVSLFGVQEKEEGC